METGSYLRATPTCNAHSGRLPKLPSHSGARGRFAQTGWRFHIWGDSWLGHFRCAQVVSPEACAKKKVVVSHWRLTSELGAHRPSGQRSPSFTLVLASRPEGKGKSKDDELREGVGLGDLFCVRVLFCFEVLDESIPFLGNLCKLKNCPPAAGLNRRKPRCWRSVAGDRRANSRRACMPTPRGLSWRGRRSLGGLPGFV